MKPRVISALLLMLCSASCNQNPLEVIVSRCPAVAVVGDVGTLTQFKGEGRTTEDMLFTASISQIVSDCDQGESVENAITFSLLAQAGPALANDSVSVRYFVAVMRDNSQLVSKKIFDAELEFGADGIAESEQSVRQFIPTIDQARRYDYEVLLGFQISAEDALFNIQR